MNPKDMDLGKLVKEQIGQPYRLRLDLAQQIADFEFSLAGRVIAVWDAPSSLDYVDIKFNRQDADAIRFTMGKVLAVPFTKLFITTPAGQTGNFDILYGPDSFDVLRIYPTPPALDMTLTNLLAVMQGVLDQLQGSQAEIAFGVQPVGVAAVNVLPADPARTGGVIQATSTNAGIIYLGFDNTVGVANCFIELAAGAAWSVDDWRGDVWAEASVVAQNVNAGEW